MPSHSVKLNQIINVQSILSLTSAVVGYTTGSASETKKKKTPTTTKKVHFPWMHEQRASLDQLRWILLRQRDTVCSVCFLFCFFVCLLFQAE